MHVGARFELKVDEVLFVGHPMLAYKKQDWEFKVGDFKGYYKTLQDSLKLFTSWCFVRYSVLLKKIATTVFNNYWTNCKDSFQWRSVKPRVRILLH